MGWKVTEPLAPTATLGEGHRPGHGELHTEGAASSAQPVGTGKDSRAPAGAAAVEGGWRRLWVSPPRCQGCAGPPVPCTCRGSRRGCPWNCGSPDGSPGCPGSLPHRRPAACRIPSSSCSWFACGDPVGPPLPLLDWVSLLFLFLSCFPSMCHGLSSTPLGRLALPCLLLRMNGALTPCAAHRARCPLPRLRGWEESGRSQERRHAHRGVVWVLPMYEGAS